MRLRPGDVVEVAGPAGLALARVTTAESRPPRLGVTLSEPWRGPERPPGPRLAVALIAWPRFDWAVEKSAELGAAALWPLACERVKPGLTQAAAARAGRWARLAAEARKQSGRPAPMLVHPLLELKALLELPGPGYFLSPAPRRTEKDPASAPSPLLAIGPEGGFTPGEEEAFLAAGFRPWNLGPIPLRTETAALAALARLQAAV